MTLLIVLKFYPSQIKNTLTGQATGMITLTTIDIVTRMAVAIGLGTIIGLERTLAGKTAGMRTYAMVALGSSLFILISEIVLSTVSNPELANPLLIASSIITGIGFICAGLFIFQSNKITGLTTAAGIWVSAGVGMASGFGFFSLAVIATVAALFVFTLMWFIENIFKKHSYNLEIERNKIHKNLANLDNNFEEVNEEER